MKSLLDVQLQRADELTEVMLDTMSVVAGRLRRDYPTAFKEMTYADLQFSGTVAAVWLTCFALAVEVRGEDHQAVLGVRVRKAMAEWNDSADEAHQDLHAIVRDAAPKVPANLRKGALHFIAAAWAAESAGLSRSNPEYAQVIAGLQENLLNETIGYWAECVPEADPGARLNMHPLIFVWASIVTGSVAGAAVAAFLKPLWPPHIAVWPLGLYVLYLAFWVRAGDLQAVCRMAVQRAGRTSGRDLGTAESLVYPANARWLAWPIPITGHAAMQAMIWTNGPVILLIASICGQFALRLWRSRPPARRLCRRIAEHIESSPATAVILLEKHCLFASAILRELKETSAGDAPGCGTMQRDEAVLAREEPHGA